MIRLGLTGSIGMGKSTVTRQFALLGAATLDSDHVVHGLLQEKGKAVKPVADIFPKALEGNHINRRKLGAEVFGDPLKLRQLEAILHPLVHEAQERFIRKARLAGKQMVVLDIPLLFETGAEKRCDATLVVTAPAFIQRLRVFARAHMTEEKFRHILKAQMPDAEKRRRADFIVPTGLGKAASFRAAKRVYFELINKG